MLLGAFGGPMKFLIEKKNMWKNIGTGGLAQGKILGRVAFYKWVGGWWFKTERGGTNIFNLRGGNHYMLEFGGGDDCVDGGGGFEWSKHFSQQSKQAHRRSLGPWNSSHIIVVLTSLDSEQGLSRKCSAWKYFGLLFWSLSLQRKSKLCVV